MKLGVNGWRLHGQRTGVGRYLLNLIRHWDEELVAGRFDEVTFYTPTPIDRGEIPIPNRMGIRVLSSGLPMLLWENLRFGPAAADDVLFCPSYSRPILARGRCVVTIFEATLKLYPEYFPRRSWYSLPRFYLGLYGWSGRHSALVITTTEAARQDIVKAYGIAPERIRVVPLAPAEIFRPESDEARVSETRQKFLEKDVPFFLHVGKMTPRRNVPQLMEAFAELKNHSSLPHKLLLVGKTEAVGDLRAKARELGIAPDFVHRDYVTDEDLALLYNAAEAFVLPYSYEALSLTALEAQASGLPVITADTPGLREMTGGEAILLRETNVASLADAMSRLARDGTLRQSLAAKGLAHSRQFSWRRTAKETLRVLAEAGQPVRSNS